MNADQLKRGEEIQSDLKHLKDQKDRYEKSKDFLHSERLDFSSGQYRVANIDARFIDFKTMKILALNEINKRIEELEKEFENL